MCAQSVVINFTFAALYVRCFLYRKMWPKCRSFSIKWEVCMATKSPERYGRNVPILSLIAKLHVLIGQHGYPAFQPGGS